jgi:hypothetical protein
MTSAAISSESGAFTDDDVREWILVRATRVGVGIALIGTAAIAALGAEIEIDRRTTAAARVARGAARTAVSVAHRTPLHRLIDETRTFIVAWSDRGRAEGDAGIERVAAAWDAILSDLIRQVLRHVDVNDLLGSLDIDAVAARIDIAQLIDRIDVNEIAERIDIEAVVRRLDLPAIAHEVLDEIEVQDIIRESSGSLTVQTVDALRARGVDADRRVASLVDHALGRRDERDLRIEDDPQSADLRSGDGPE